MHECFTKHLWCKYIPILCGNMLHKTSSVAQATRYILPIFVRKKNKNKKLFCPR